MIHNSTHDRQALELTKDGEHFVLVYPNTVAGRIQAREAVRDWLINHELNFDGNDARRFMRAIETNRFRLTIDPLSARRLQWGRPRRR